MPQSELRRDRVLELLPQPISAAAFEEILSISKAELEGQDGDAMTVSVTPDRLDLLSEGGLGLYLQGATEAAKGTLRVRELEEPSAPLSIEVDASVGAVRPAIAGVVVIDPEPTGLDAGLLEEAVRFQELLHATVGRGRRAASLGIYPIERLVPPFRYALEPLEEVRFVPLDGSEEVTAGRFFTEHPLAQRYGAFGRREDRCLTLRDARGLILSLPPILNGRTGGEARIGDRRLLLESTGLSDRTVREMLGLLLVAFVSRGWSVAPVETRAGSAVTSDGRVVYAARSLDLDAETLRTLAGRSYPSPEVEHRLARSRLSARPHAGGWSVEAPPWRPDLLTGVDVAEDVILASALEARDGLLPASATRGRRRPETLFRRRVATRFLGLGLAAPYTSVLVSEAAVARLRGASPIRLRNPPSQEFAFLRDRLLLSHLEVLGHNTRHSYPQSIGEVGPVVVADPAAESGGITRYRAGALIAREGAGFADAAALVEYLLRTIDIVSVREPAELPGTIPGRAARVRVAGELIAELGEVHPQVLSEIGVPVPVAWAELDLTALYPLLGGRDSD